jgi:hypothetical protein
MHLRRFFGKFALIVVLFLPAAAWAAHPLLTDDTGTQGKGKFQVETSGSWLSDKPDANGTETREIDTLATAVFTAGVAETVDLAVTVPYVWTETRAAGAVTKQNGISDTVVEMKWRFFEKDKLSMALKPGVVIPTGDDEKGLGTGHYGYTAFLLSTYAAELWAFDANLGYLHLENRAEERVDRWFASLAARYNVSEQWKLVGEAGIARNPDPADSSHPAFAQAGVIFSPKDNLDLSVGYVIGLNDAEIDHTVRAGVTMRF